MSTGRQTFVYIIQFRHIIPTQSYLKAVFNLSPYSCCVADKEATHSDIQILKSMVIMERGIETTIFLLKAEPNLIKMMIKKSPWPFVMLLSTRGA